LEAVEQIVRPGITTLEIDEFCEHYIVDTLKARPGSKGQYGFPYSVNTSPNYVVCHGMPSATKVLKNGDIVNVDVTVEKDGYYGDSSKTYCVGQVAVPVKRLVDIAQECLYKAIKIVKPGATLGDIGHAIQEHAEKNSYSVVREYCGHGIGKEMHENPQVLHFGQSGTGLVLEPGMTFTIEPMVNQGKRAVKVLNDKWTVVTKDRRLSAQWEHTILVTEKGFEVLTLREDERDVFQNLS
jgi:methionyl aminopeptidase